MPATYVETNDKSEFFSEGGGQHFTLVTADTTVAAATSGDLVIYGAMIGIALNDYNHDAGSIVLDLTGGHTIEVHAVDNSGNSAVNIGDWLYWDEAGGEVNKDATNGVALGTAMEALATGTTDDIGVKFWPSPDA